MPSHLLRWCWGGCTHGSCGVQMPRLTKVCWAGWRDGRCCLRNSEKLEGQREVLVVAMHERGASACHWVWCTPLTSYSASCASNSSAYPNPLMRQMHLKSRCARLITWEWRRVWFPKSSSIGQQQVAAAPGKQEAASAAWAKSARQRCRKVSCTVGRRRRPFPQEGAQVREEACTWKELMRTCTCAHVH